MPTKVEPLKSSVLEKRDKTSIMQKTIFRINNIPAILWGDMTMWFSVTEEELESKQTISTPIGQNLYWDYYCFVREHPVSRWKIPTHILYGSKDEQSERDIILKFTEQFACQLE